MKRNNDIEKILLCLTLLNALPLSGTGQLRAAELSVTPRLVVEITVDQLRSDYLEYFSTMFKSDGFIRLWDQGLVYNNVSYPFSPVDRASAITCIATGTTPQYNQIPADHWFDRKTLHQVYCVDDNRFRISPDKIATSTISDQLKIATNGKAQVYGIAWNEDAAVLSVGHASDGAFWIDSQTNRWTTSGYYSQAAQQWVRNYNTVLQNTSLGLNEYVTQAALQCISLNSMGKDDVTDYLSVTLSARLGGKMGTRTEMEGVYRELDDAVASLISGVELQVGKNNVLFVVTSTGNSDEPEVDYGKYNIPSGTFYINRTSQLLNMYLSAIYGQGRWVDGYYKNQIFLSHKLIEDKKLSYSDVLRRSREMLLWTTGVATVDSSPAEADISGDLLIEVKPGWKIMNEDTQDTYVASKASVPFQVILLGKDIKPGHVNTHVTVDQIAPTIASCIHIRAPNGCSARVLPK